jgi:hypothetical protein
MLDNSVLAEPEPQRFATLAPTAPTPNVMFNKGKLSKMSQSVTVFDFS